MAWSRRRIRRGMVRHTYLFTLTSGETFRGLIEDSDADAVVLQQVHLIQSDGSPVQVDGRLILERLRILYAQET